MSIYIINMLMIGVYSLFYKLLSNRRRNNKTIKKLLISIVTLQLFIILALRKNTVGVDINGYIRQFHYISYSTFNDILLLRHEIGYKLLVKFISYITNNEQVFLAIIAGISIFPIGRFIYKYSKMPFISFALYISFNFYAFVFSGLRQAIAFSIVFISYDYIREQKLFKFLVTVILAALFHKSAIFFIPAYAISKIKLNKKSMSAFLLGSLLIFVFRRSIMELVTKYIFDSYNIVESRSFTWFLLSLFIYIICLLFNKGTIERNYRSNELYMLVATGISIMLFATVATNAMRMANYYYIFSILLVPEVIYSIKDSKLALLCAYLLIIGIVILSFWFLYNDGYGIVPYQYFWE